jgi:hypothetical protein
MPEVLNLVEPVGVEPNRCKPSVGFEVLYSLVALEVKVELQRGRGREECKQGARRSGKHRVAVWDWSGWSKS